MVRPWSNSFIDNWRSYTYHAVYRAEYKWLWQHSSTFTFGGVLYKIGKPDQIHWPILWSFFFLYVSGRHSHFEMFSGPDFEESFLNIWSLLPAPAKSVLFCLRYVKLYYHANQIWHVCNNLLDAMAHWVPYGNCFSWLKKNSQTLREERTLQQTMMNNETMLSECSTFLRNIRFGIRFLVENVAGFSFTLNWFLFRHFFSSTGKKKT